LVVVVVGAAACPNKWLTTALNPDRLRFEGTLMALTGTFKSA